MLYTHTQQVIKKQRLRDNKEGDQDEEGIDIEGEEEYIYATMYVWYEFVSTQLWPNVKYTWKYDNILVM